MGDVYALRKECLKARQSMGEPPIDPNGEAHMAYTSVIDYIDGMIHRQKRYKYAKRQSQSQTQPQA